MKMFYYFFLVTGNNLPQVLKSSLVEGHNVFSYDFDWPLLHFKSCDFTVFLTFVTFEIGTTTRCIN